jgi:hypothetical protein
MLTCSLDRATLASVIIATTLNLLNKTDKSKLKMLLKKCMLIIHRILVSPLTVGRSPFFGPPVMVRHLGKIMTFEPLIASAAHIHYPHEHTSDHQSDFSLEQLA